MQGDMFAAVAVDPTANDSPAMQRLEAFRRDLFGYGERFEDANVFELILMHGELNNIIKALRNERDGK